LLTFAAMAKVSLRSAPQAFIHRNQAKKRLWQAVLQRIKRVQDAKKDQ